MLDPETARAMVRAREARRIVRRAAELDRERLRAMTPEKKLQLQQALWRQAWSLAAAGVRARHPGWSEAKVKQAVREVFERDAP